MTLGDSFDTDYLESESSFIHIVFYHVKRTTKRFSLMEGNGGNKSQTQNLI